MRRTCLAVLAVLVLCCAPARAAEKTQEVLVTGARVVEFGVFASTVERRAHTASVGDGIRDRAKDFALVRHGSVVEAALGTGFGIRYQLTGAPRGAMVLVDVVVRHPQMVNPETQQPMTHSTAQYPRVIGAVEHTLWSFDTPAGLLPGEYVIEILYQGRLLVRQIFRVSLKKGEQQP